MRNLRQTAPLRPWKSLNHREIVVSCISLGLFPTSDDFVGDAGYLHTQDHVTAHDQYHHNAERNVASSPHSSDTNSAKSTYYQEDDTVADEDGEQSYTDMLNDDGMDEYMW